MTRKPKMSESCSKATDLRSILLPDRIGALAPARDLGLDAAGGEPLLQVLLDLADERASRSAHLVEALG